LPENANIELLNFLDFKRFKSEDFKQTISDQNKSEKENFNFNFGYFSRWKKISKSIKLKSIVSILSKIGPSTENKKTIINSYSIIKRIENDGKNLLLTLQDVRGLFKIPLRHEIYKDIVDEIKEENELIFKIMIKFENFEISSLTCTKVMKIN
jgi:hypothetical protein